MPKKVLEATYKGLEGESRHPINCIYNPQSEFLEHRKYIIKLLFYSSDMFGFKSETVHFAVQIYDKVLGHRQDAIDFFRKKYTSCNSVISQ